MPPLCHGPLHTLPSTCGRPPSLPFVLFVFCRPPFFLRVSGKKDVFCLVITSRTPVGYSPLSRGLSAGAGPWGGKLEMAGGGAHEGLPLRDPGPAAWPNVLEDVLNLGSCCAPAKLDFGVGPASHSVVAARGRRRAGVHGGEGDASRSTIGPLQPAGGAWEFDDAYPDTWPEGVDLDRLSYAPAPQLHSGPAPHEAVLSAATTPSVVCRMQVAGPCPPHAALLPLRWSVVVRCGMLKAAVRAGWATRQRGRRC